MAPNYPFAVPKGWRQERLAIDNELPNGKDGHGGNRKGSDMAGRQGEDHFGADSSVLLSTEGATAIVTLNRPDKRNAINLAMLEALDEVSDRIEHNPSLRAVIVTGAGDAFCAGGDIVAWSDMDPEAFATDWIRRGHRTFDRLATLRPPTVAVLNGNALGGGLELAACCDFRIAEEKARIGLPEAGLGMVPGWSGTQRLVRRFGAQIVRRMAVGGELLQGAEALSAGLVDRLAADGEGLDAARGMAATIAGRGRAATETAKAMLAIAEGESAPAAVDALAGRLIAGTGELREGVAAFRQKRKPKFTD